MERKIRIIRFYTKKNVAIFMDFKLVKSIENIHNSVVDETSRKNATANARNFQYTKNSNHYWVGDDKLTTEIHKITKSFPLCAVFLPAERFFHGDRAKSIRFLVTL